MRQSKSRSRYCRCDLNGCCGRLGYCGWRHSSLGGCVLSFLSLLSCSVSDILVGVLGVHRTDNLTSERPPSTSSFLRRHLTNFGDLPPSHTRVEVLVVLVCNRTYIRKHILFSFLIFLVCLYYLYIYGFANSDMGYTKSL